jgi:hypothetical protein
MDLERSLGRDVAVPEVTYSNEWFRFLSIRLGFNDGW